MKQKRNNNPKECPICGRPFASGKALGGHMWVHYVSHPLPSAAMTNKKAMEDSVESIHNQLGENLMMNSSVESELSSQWKSPTRTRSRRRRRFMVAEAEAEAKEAKEEQQESFIPDPDMQNAAQTLIGLSMGSTELIKGEPRVTIDLVKEGEDNIQLTEFDNEEAVRVQAPDKPLDKKMKSKVEEDDYEDDENNSAGGDRGSDSDAVQVGQRHQCPVCLKMFASGQGLGGHKRSHIAKSGAGKGDKPSTSSAGKSDKPSAAQLRPCLDHNLPPPETDEEVISIVDLSTSSSDEELFG